MLLSKSWINLVLIYPYSKHSRASERLPDIFQPTFNTHQYWETFVLILNWWWGLNLFSHTRMNKRREGMDLNDEIMCRICLIYLGGIWNHRHSFQGNSTGLYQLRNKSQFSFSAVSSQQDNTTEILSSILIQYTYGVRKIHLVFIAQNPSWILCCIHHDHYIYYPLHPCFSYFLESRYQRCY